jgi:hypothetical protein
VLGFIAFSTNLPFSFFDESKPMKNFKWVHTNAGVEVDTSEQQVFLDSDIGQKLMDGLLDAAKSENNIDYLKYALIIEGHLNKISGSTSLSI